MIPLRRQVRNSFVQAEPGMPSLIPRPGTEVRFTPIPRFHTTSITHSILLIRFAICLFALRYRHCYIGSHICLVFLLLFEEHLISPVRLYFSIFFNLFQSFSIQCALSKLRSNEKFWFEWFGLKSRLWFCRNVSSVSNVEGALVFKKEAWLSSAGCGLLRVAGKFH